MPVDAAPRAVLPTVLGLVSLGLGAAGLAVPDTVARLTGLAGPPGPAGRGARAVGGALSGLPAVRGLLGWRAAPAPAVRRLVRVVGARELAVVPGLLLGASPGGWLWARVAGDAADLALLARALPGSAGETRRRLLRTGGVVGAIAAADLAGALLASRPARALQLTAVVTVSPDRQQAYALWRDLPGLARFAAHLLSVETTGDGVSHWTARGPAGTRVSWDAELVQDEPGSVIAWRSVGSPLVPNSGCVRFTPAPGGRGTQVRVELSYRIPAGRAGAAFARLLGEDPHKQVEDDLRRFKQVLETGDVVRSDGSPGGTDQRRQVLQHPAQPTTA